MLFNVVEDAIKINNTTMDYVAFGNGTKPLVIIPGLSLNRVKGAGMSLAYMYRIFIKADRKKNIFLKICIFSVDNGVDSRYNNSVLKRE